MVCPIQNFVVQNFVREIIDGRGFKGDSVRDIPLDDLPFDQLDIATKVFDHTEDYRKGHPYRRPGLATIRVHVTYLENVRTTTLYVTLIEGNDPTNQTVREQVIKFTTPITECEEGYNGVFPQGRFSRDADKVLLNDIPSVMETELFKAMAKTSLTPDSSSRWEINSSLSEEDCKFIQKLFRSFPNKKLYFKVYMDELGRNHLNESDCEGPYYCTEYVFEPSKNSGNGLLIFNYYDTNGNRIITLSGKIEIRAN